MKIVVVKTATSARPRFEQSGGRGRRVTGRCIAQQRPLSDPGLSGISIEAGGDKVPMAFQQRSAGSEYRATDRYRKHTAFLDPQRIAASTQQYLSPAQPRGRWPNIGEQSEAPEGKGICVVDLDIGTAGDGLPPARVVAVD